MQSVHIGIGDVVDEGQLLITLLPPEITNKSSRLIPLALFRCVIFIHTGFAELLRKWSLLQASPAKSGLHSMLGLKVIESGSSIMVPTRQHSPFFAPTSPAARCFRHILAAPGRSPSAVAKTHFPDAGRFRRPAGARQQQPADGLDHRHRQRCNRPSTSRNASPRCRRSPASAWAFASVSVSATGRKTAFSTTDPNPAVSLSNRRNRASCCSAFPIVQAFRGRSRSPARCRNCRCAAASGSSMFRARLAPLRHLGTQPGRDRWRRPATSGAQRQRARRVLLDAHRDHLTIGRQPDCDIVLRDIQASPNHARIERRG